MVINSFSEEYDFLSNFHIAPIIYRGLHYPTVEHLFQGRKTLDFNFRDEIRNAPTPGKAKRLGRKAPLRADWEQIKVAVMYECLTLKFSQNLALKKKLMETEGRFLIEGNYWHDNFWGDCGCSNCPAQGENVLGRLLMSIRDDLLMEDKWI